jgi:predicted nucleic acid-binding protein
VGLTVLDAGVVIGVLDRGDPHHDACRRALSAAIERNDAVLVPASAYAECLVAPTRRGPEAVAAVDAFLADLSAEVEPITRQVAARAAGLRATHGSRLRLPDALVVASAIHADADRLLTTDRGWPALEVPIEVAR